MTQKDSPLLASNAFASSSFLWMLPKSLAKFAGNRRGRRGVADLEVVPGFFALFSEWADGCERGDRNRSGNYDRTFIRVLTMPMRSRE